MNVRQVFLSILHLFFVCLFFGAGFFCVSLAYLPHLRIQLSDIILFRSELCTQAGAILFGCAFFLLLGLYRLNRGRFLHFAMGKNVLEIKEKVVRETVNGFFQTKCPNFSLTHLEISGKSQIDLRVQLRSQSEPEEVETMLENIEKDLSVFLYDRFGYKQPFTLSIDAAKLEIS